MDQKAQKSKIKQILTYVFSEDRLLGEGAFGVVYKGEDKNTKQKVAIKQIQQSKFQNDLIVLKNLKREIEIMQDLKHENIVQLLNFTQTASNVYIILEFCDGGDILSLMKKNEDKRFSEEIAIKYFRQITEAFKMLHSKGIIHRDIKPANILLQKGIAKISDFGFARMLDQTNLNLQQKLTALGSPLYMSPQILSQEQFSSKCDIWSLGVMFYEMIYGRTPWTASSQIELLNKINSQPLQFPSDVKSSYNTKDIIIRMLKVQENERISWEEIFAHPLLSEEDQYTLETTIQNNISHLEQFKIVGLFNNNDQYYQMFQQQSQLQQAEKNQCILIDSVVLFHRNKYILFNILASHICLLKLRSELPVSNEIFLSACFLYLKLFLGQIKSTAEALKGNEIFDPNFNQQDFFNYKNSILFQQSANLIEYDFNKADCLYQQIVLKIINRYSIQIQQQQPYLSAEIQLLKQQLSNPYEFDDNFTLFYNQVMNQFISAIIEKNNLLDIELKKKLYTILKYCFIVQDFDTYFQFDANNPNFQQFLSFYHHNDQISFQELQKEVDIQIEQLLKSG
ncbi:hypothetical protein ABPG73_022671 [Tetrahymena malaccensis]